jgi:hypothetical protein
METRYEGGTVEGMVKVKVRRSGFGAGFNGRADSVSCGVKKLSSVLGVAKPPKHDS